MTKAVQIFLVLAILSPSVVFAQIISTTESEVETGGNTAGSGGVVETGPSASSVKTTNVVGSGGGVVDIEVEATVNGETHTESIQKQAPVGGVRVEVFASTSGSRLPTIPALKAPVSVFSTSSVNIFSIFSTSGWGGFGGWFWQPQEAAEEDEEDEEVANTALITEEKTEPRGFWKRVVEKLRLAFWF